MSEHTLVSVGAAPQRPFYTADWMDGHNAAVTRVRVDMDDAARCLRVSQAGDELAAWPYDGLRALPDQSARETMVLRTVDDPAARLILRSEEDIRITRSRAPHLTRHTSHVRKRHIFGWAIAAVAAVALILFVMVPFIADRLATILPPRGEKALGDATFEQIRSALDETGFGLPLCTDEDGLAALDTIRDRLTAHLGLETELTVQVLDHDMVNAFALPGGYVVFFRGLIDAAESPEEIAAVFAHEIGHVEARDPTRIALRSAGSIGVLGLLLGDFAGGAVVLLLTEQIIRADYTQEAEAAADAYAHRVLLARDLPPSAVATFFERILAEYGDSDGIIQHLMSHPALGDRIAAARAAEPAEFEVVPVLTDAEWQALKGICGGRRQWPYN